MVQQSVSNISNSIEIKAVFFRYFFFVFVGLEVLIIPKIIDEEIYSSIEYVKHIIFLSPLFMLGIPSGMIYRKMKGGLDVEAKLMRSSIVLSLIVGTNIAFWSNNIIYALPVILFVFCAIVESELKIKQRFNLALLLKPLISILLIINSFLLFKNLINVQVYLNLSFCLGAIVWLALSKVKIFKGKLFEINEFIKCIRFGFLITLSTLIFGLFIFFDRFIAKNYYYEILPSYSLAFSFSQMVVLGLSTLNYISTIKIGEAHDRIQKKDLIKLLYRSTVILSIVLFLSFIITKYFFVSYFKEFEFFSYFLLITLSKSIFITIGVITPMIYYKDKIIHSVIILTVAFILQITLTYKIYIPNNYDYLYILLSSGIILIIVSIYNLSLSIRLAK